MFNSEYGSNDGFSTKIWGPAFWFVLHLISMNYPCSPTAEDKRNYMHFFRSLQNVLPCGACRKNMKKNLDKTGFGPHVFHSRESLSYYVYRLHNEVSEMLGKGKGPSFRDVLDAYEMFRAKCGKTEGKENGCVRQVNGRKARMIINVLPESECTGEGSIQVDERCYGASLP